MAYLMLIASTGTILSVTKSLQWLEKTTDEKYFQIWL